MPSQRISVGAHYSKAAYSIAIQIKDLVRCLSVRPRYLLRLSAGERNSPLQMSSEQEFILRYCNFFKLVI